MPPPDYLPEYLKATFVGPFDYTVLALLVGANGWLWWRGGFRALGCGLSLALACCFCLVLPACSISAELERTRRPPGIPVDAFELLYGYFRFPMYWALFAFQCACFRLYSRRKTQPINQ